MRITVGIVSRLLKSTDSGRSWIESALFCASHDEKNPAGVSARGIRFQNAYGYCGDSLMSTP